jgi:guanosine-3',5'-bis(diphosphate) 3'-pyrophosphohydrolase
MKGTKARNVPPLSRYIDQSRFTKEEKELLNRAISFAGFAHENQTRQSGEPYITHPLHVAGMLFEMGFDMPVIIAGLLHDTVEDTRVSLKDIKDTFGSEIAGLVDGVTKISQIKSENIKQDQAENIRKMLLSMVHDIRIILIKLADKLHNMRTLEYLEKSRARRIARETIDIYAPLADRLGMARVKVELEDLALKHLDPDFYDDLRSGIVQRREIRDRFIDKVTTVLKAEFARHQVKAKIYGRAKHFYSIYRKMKNKDRNLDEIFDLFAIRIITSSVKECYEVLGIVHEIWMPVRGRFKDYIAMPKSNMYQSLHTSVVGPEGKTLEVQIRTDKMDLIAEEGIAAHWAYKEGRKNVSSIERDLKWLKKLKDWKNNLDNPSGFMEDLQKDLLVDEIYVFTPRGDVIELPAGSTPIDFAYKIHTEIGHRCIGAKVNGRITPLRKPLHSCEAVEILTSKNAAPTREWLDVVKTSRARSKIRAYFTRRETPREGEGDHAEKGPLDAKEHVRKSRVTHGGRVRRVDPAAYDVVAEGERNVQINLAKCCTPHPGDEIIGYITRGKGITVHRTECRNLRAIKDYTRRMIAVEWEEKTKKIYNLVILSRDRTGLLMDIATAIANSNANIVELHLKANHGGETRAEIRIQLTDEQQMRIIKNDVANIPEVISLEFR